MKKQELLNKCLRCAYWKTNQSELNYVQGCGFCVSEHLRFTTTNYSSAYLLDRNNISEKYKGVNRFENKLNNGVNIEKSRYLLVTDEEFGCIHFKPNN